LENGNQGALERKKLRHSNSKASGLGRQRHEPEGRNRGEKVKEIAHVRIVPASTGEKKRGRQGATTIMVTEQYQLAKDRN